MLAGWGDTWTWVLPQVDMAASPVHFLAAFRAHTLTWSWKSSTHPIISETGYMKVPEQPSLRAPAL